jgi:hypothetical protein
VPPDQERGLRLRSSESVEYEEDSMNAQQRTDAKQWLRKRRSERIELNVPVVLHKPSREGSLFSERTQTLVVNAHGALLFLAEKVAPKQTLFMQNSKSGEQRELPGRLWSLC